jgi:hypothetical protein
MRHEVGKSFNNFNTLSFSSSYMYHNTCDSVSKSAATGIKHKYKKFRLPLSDFRPRNDLFA